MWLFLIAILWEGKWIRIPIVEGSHSLYKIGTWSLWMNSDEFLIPIHGTIPMMVPWLRRAGRGFPHTGAAFPSSWEGPSSRRSAWPSPTPTILRVAWTRGVARGGAGGRWNMGNVRTRRYGNFNGESDEKYEKWWSTIRIHRSYESYSYISLVFFRGVSLWDSHSYIMLYIFTSHDSHNF